MAVMMETLEHDAAPKPMEAPERQAELTDLLRSFNAVTESLRRSHEMLGAQVRELRCELAEKNRELEQRGRLAALGEMAAGVAHEIRNPLGGIRLYADLLARELADRPEQRDRAERIAAGVEALDHLVGDVLLFAGMGAMKRGRCFLGDVFAEVRAAVEPRLTAEGVDLDCDPALGMVELNADPRQIARAFINLVANALDVSRAGLCVRVAVQPGAKKGRLRVAVEDAGPGISESDLERIFNPFFTTKSEGTGLGLAIVHRIVEAHDGRVWAENRATRGARFIVELPLRPADPAETGALIRPSHCSQSGGTPETLCMLERRTGFEDVVM